MENKNSVNNSRIKNFPVNMFTIIMGLLGFTIMLYRAYHLQWLPEWPYAAALIVSSLFFLFFLFIYGYKIIVYFDDVKKEFTNVIRINFFSAIPVSFLLMSIALYSFYPFLAVPLWLIGVLGTLYMTFYTMNFWISRNFEIHHINPAWFIPAVGNILVPIVGTDIAPYWLNAYFLFIGLLFWLVLFTIIFYRIIFHKQLEEKLMPTLFILIAPPAVGFISYIRLFASVDLLLLALILTAYFFVILLMLRIKNFMKIRFYVSWWAYIFPLNAVSIASMIAYQVIGGYFKYMAWLMILLVFFVLSVVLYYTVVNVYNKTICINEEV